MAKPLQYGTRIRLLYQISMYDIGSLEHVDADAGREFIVVESIWHPDSGPTIHVVEPDQFDEEANAMSYEQDALLIEDLEACEVIPS